MSFERLGGKYLLEYLEAQGEQVTSFSFPLHVNKEILQTILKNTCFECGGLMKDGTVIKNQKFRVLTDNGYIPYPEGPATLQQCRKCTSCGHSHIGNQLLPINPHV